MHSPTVKIAITLILLSFPFKILCWSFESRFTNDKNRCKRNFNTQVPKNHNLGPVIARKYQNGGIEKRSLMIQKMDPEMDLDSRSESGHGQIINLVQSPQFLRSLGLMTIAGAGLGPWLDGQHGAFGVLTYHQPFNLVLGETTILKTALWVPPLFGVAGFLICGLYLLFDSILNTDERKITPSVPKVLYGISFFAAQYYLSGLLAFAGADLADIHAVLAALAVVGFMVFDFSLAGFIVSGLTALGGPLIEIFLINKFDLYDYAKADFYGIDSWIPWVYFMGGPAVGNLSRLVYDYFRKQ